jgi:hypothetical protein
VAPSADRWKSLALPLVLASTLVLYSRGLGFDLVYDDAMLVGASRLTGALSDLVSLWGWDLWESTTATDDPTSGYYRPLFLLSLWLDRAVSPTLAWPAVHHLQGVAWHLLVVGLAAALARRLGAGPVAAAAGAALAALHPAQLASVQFIAARNDLMVVALVLCAALARRWWVVLLLSAAAALCKESAIAAPLVLLVLGRWGPERRWPWRTAAAAAGGVVIALGLRTLVGVGLPGALEASATGSAAVEIAALGRSASRAATHWLAVVGWPVGLAPGASVVWVDPLPLTAALVGALGLGLLAWRAGPGGRSALVAGALLTAPALAGVARNGLVPDRYLYAFLVMGGVALALAIERARSPANAAPAFAARALAPLMLGVMLIGGGALSLRTLPIWASDVSLWRAGSDAHPQPFTWGAYGKALEEVGRLDEAAHFIGRAATGSPPLPHACMNAARIHLRRNDPMTAGMAGERALAAGCPPVPELLSPTAIGLAVAGQWDLAEERALAVDRDPTGQSVLVRCAAAARRGDLGVLRATAQRATGDPAQLQAQVVWLLRQAHDEAAALAVEQATL